MRSAFPVSTHTKGSLFEGGFGLYLSFTPRYSPRPRAPNQWARHGQSADNRTNTVGKTALPRQDTAALRREARFSKIRNF